MEYVVGVDAGGSSTKALLAAADGEIVQYAQSDAANLQRIGAAGLTDRVARLVNQMTHLLPPGACLARLEIGAAGLDRQAEREELLSHLQAAGLASSYGLQSDSLIALYGGTLGEPGLIVIAGTGSIVDGIDGGGRRHRVGGWGHLMGDEGSGYYIGRRALQAAVRAADSRGPATSLVSRVLEHFGASQPQDLIPAVYRPLLQPNQVAKLARLVGTEAAAGDSVALQIISEAAYELALAAATVAGKLGEDPQSLLAFAAGGLFNLGSLLFEPLQANLEKMLPGLLLRPLPYPPVVGATLLALSRAGGLTTAVLTNVQRRTAELQLVCGDAATIQ